MPGARGFRRREMKEWNGTSRRWKNACMQGMQSQVGCLCMSAGEESLLGCRKSSVTASAGRNFFCFPPPFLSPPRVLPWLWLLILSAARTAYFKCVLKAARKLTTVRANALGSPTRTHMCQYPSIRSHEKREIRSHTMLTRGKAKERRKNACKDSREVRHILGPRSQRQQDYVFFKHRQKIMCMTSFSLFFSRCLPLQSACSCMLWRESAGDPLCLLSDLRFLSCNSKPFSTSLMEILRAFPASVKGNQSTGTYHIMTGRVLKETFCILNRCFMSDADHWCRRRTKWRLWDICVFKASTLVWDGVLLQLKEEHRMSLKEGCGSEFRGTGVGTGKSLKCRWSVAGLTCESQACDS